MMMRCRLAPRIAATTTLFAFAFPQKRYNHSTSGGNAPPVQPSPSAVPHGTTPQLPKHTATDSLPIKDLASRYGRCILGGGETLSPYALHHVLSSHDSHVDADAQLLICHGARIDAKWEGTSWDRSSQTPLYVAAKHRHAKVAKLLLESGADVNAVVDSSRETPLHAAVASGSVSTVKLLVDHGADVNAKNNRGSVPLHFATAYHPPWYEAAAIVKVLLDAGANASAKDEKDVTPLHKAATRNEGVVKVLIDHGADLNAKDKIGMTPLHHAARLWDECVKVLADGGADLNAVDDRSRTPLHIAAMERRGGPTARALIGAGADPNRLDDKHRTPLHVVATLRGGATAHALIDGGGTVSPTGKHKAIAASTSGSSPKGKKKKSPRSAK